MEVGDDIFDYEEMSGRIALMCFDCFGTCMAHIKWSPCWSSSLVKLRTSFNP